MRNVTLAYSQNAFTNIKLSTKLNNCYATSPGECQEFERDLNVLNFLTTLS
ncbi:unnamed protein product [Ceratitis capitata]|uniref:(Mediterranean fruit fly) hypothetical protein n=1 Tax=Ceratitis capitata TaxID=7213 RepID=A0A811UU98_CERCA|nr:unnamed protein product [Ceratitis capitata]